MVVSQSKFVLSARGMRTQVPAAERPWRFILLLIENGDVAVSIGLAQKEKALRGERGDKTRRGRGVHLVDMDAHFLRVSTLKNMRVCVSRGQELYCTR